MSSVGMDERYARAALSRVVEPGHVKRSAFEDVPPVELWAKIQSGEVQVEEWSDRAATVDPVRDLERGLPLGIRFVVPGDDEWPVGMERLRGLAGGEPFGLWVRGSGHLRQATERAVSLVGSRACSSYGEHVASELAAGLGVLKWTTVSGGAYGIDAAAHRGALAAEGTTIAVLACGADVNYPSSNARLFDRIVDGGLVVSELPPGASPTKSRFRLRNRLIAAVSRGVVVVEAAERSGALAAAEWATRCGRALMAVPGPVTSRQSVGCHGLIRSGGTLVADVSDILEAIEIPAEVSAAAVAGAGA